MKEVKYAKRMMVEGGSEISDILALTAKPEVISFAGGLPAPELFPVADMKRMANEVLDEVGTVALQYSSAQGFPKFRQQIADRMNAKQKTNVAADDILVTSGSQQALEFSGKIFIDEGDVILCESPTYLGALNAFNGYKQTSTRLRKMLVGIIPNPYTCLLYTSDLEERVALVDKLMQDDKIAFLQEYTARKKKEVAHRGEEPENA